MIFNGVQDMYEKTYLLKFIMSHMDDYIYI